MGTIDDIRKLLQDMIAPDLKALHTRLDYIEKRIESMHDDLKSTRTEMQAGFARLDLQASLLERVNRLEHRDSPTA